MCLKYHDMEILGILSACGASSTVLYSWTYFKDPLLLYQRNDIEGYNSLCKLLEGAQ